MSSFCCQALLSSLTACVRWRWFVSRSFIRPLNGFALYFRVTPFPKKSHFSLQNEGKSHLNHSIGWQSNISSMRHVRSPPGFRKFPKQVGWGTWLPWPAARRSTHLFSLQTGSEGGSLSWAVYSSDSDNNCPPCNELEKQHQFWDQWACKCFPIAKSPHWCDSPFSFRILLPAAASNQYSTEHRWPHICAHLWFIEQLVSHW